MQDIPHSSKYVLLANSRPEKGFDLILDVAQLLPAVAFVAIANQKSIESGLADIQSRGLTNVELISKVDDMSPIYLGAHVVAVPSYQFKETFGRVPIEAHRFGKPVIGSTEGNVPYLLTESGIVLPEDAGAWAAEISRLYEDQDYYTKRTALARENAVRYSSARQRTAQRHVFDFMRAPVLVGVGSGIGNLLHCGPMLAAIARHVGAPVDVVVAEDYSGSLFLLQRDGIVNAVHRMGPAILDRHYDTVFLSHCFGAARMSFNSPKILYSRDWEMFRPGESSHEGLFNLEAVEALMGVPYDRDTFKNDYYVSSIDYKWTKGRVIGIHGGSKPGYWSSKRWTGFEELTTRLTAQGWEVRSFGIPDEYVEGAQDYTGGTIEEMVRSVSACNYFISNDSGVMNIAHALGIPVLSLFAPTEVATRAPLRKNCISLSAKRDCTPCEVTDPQRFRSGECTCISDITVEEAVQGFERLCAQAEALEAPISKGDTMENIEVPVSIGELFDKITILRIKSRRLSDEVKRKNVVIELEALEKVVSKVSVSGPELDALVAALEAVNNELWDIEDGKRQAERDKKFDEHFITFARQVYIKNDKRAEIKREINMLTGSTIVEEKSYAAY